MFIFDQFPLAQTRIRAPVQPLAKKAFNEAREKMASGFTAGFHVYGSQRIGVVQESDLEIEAEG
jgi:hypothetical protein